MTRADHGWTFSETVARLLRQALGQGEATSVRRDDLTGLPPVRLGVTVTSEDVRAVDDDGDVAGASASR